MERSGEKGNERSGRSIEKDFTKLSSPVESSAQTGCGNTEGLTRHALLAQSRCMQIPSGRG
jgi:hypothetical protein